MPQVVVSVPRELLRAVKQYGAELGHVQGDGRPNLSAAVRDLLHRGLAGDRGYDTGYASGFREGRLAGYRDFAISASRGAQALSEKAR